MEIETLEVQGKLDKISTRIRVNEQFRVIPIPNQVKHEM